MTKDNTMLKEIYNKLRCKHEYIIRGNANVGNPSIIHEEIWKIEDLLYRSRMGGYLKEQVNIESSGKVREIPKNDYGYIEVEKCRQSIIFAFKALIDDYCWQNILVVNNLAKHSVLVLREFFRRMKEEFTEFQKGLPKLQEELAAAEKKVDEVFKRSLELTETHKPIADLRDLRMIFSPTISMTMSTLFDDGLGTKKEIVVETSDKKNIIHGQTSEECYELMREINYKNNLLNLFDCTCNDKTYFEILETFFATKIDKAVKGKAKNLDDWKQRATTGRLIDIRDAIAHTNEIQIAVNLEALPHFFNDAMFLLRHLTFVKREVPMPVFIDYDFKLMSE
ncbi:MAG: hypothetical protein FWE03_00935 [Firmicutes bacterium]|nr:hypothetical protein [Bacillota bacterium]